MWNHSQWLVPTNVSANWNLTSVWQLALIWKLFVGKASVWCAFGSTFPTLHCWSLRLQIYSNEANRAAAVLTFSANAFFSQQPCFRGFSSLFLFWHIIWTHHYPSLVCGRTTMMWLVSVLGLHLVLLTFRYFIICESVNLQNVHIMLWFLCGTVLKSLTEISNFFFATVRKQHIFSGLLWSICRTENAWTHFPSPSAFPPSLCSRYTCFTPTLQGNPWTCGQRSSLVMNCLSESHWLIEDAFMWRKFCFVHMCLVYVCVYICTRANKAGQINLNKHFFYFICQLLPSWSLQCCTVLQLVFPTVPSTIMVSSSSSFYESFLRSCFLAASPQHYLQPVFLTWILFLLLTPSGGLSISLSASYLYTTASKLEVKAGTTGVF